MKKPILAFTIGLMFASGAAVAQDANARAIKARQGQMNIIMINLGMLGGMAQGKMEYNAEVAQMAADSLAAISGVHQRPLYPEGSDDMSVEGTKAMGAIWDDFDGFNKIWADFGAGAKGMQMVASNGAEAVGGAMGPLGGACKACHDKYRTPSN